MHTILRATIVYELFFRPYLFSSFSPSERAIPPCFLAASSYVFYNDNLNIEIIDVFYLNREKSKYHTPKRPFHILTKRISGYTDRIFENNSFRITTDNLLYIPANTEYARQSYGNEEIIAIHFNILSSGIFTPFLINIEEEKRNKAFREIYRVWNEKKLGFKYKCTAILYEYLSTIILEKEHSKEYWKLAKSIDYIERNLTCKLSIAKLAKRCNLGETQYRKIFTKAFGISPVKYINKLRVNDAVSKLSSDYYSIAEISELCGFSEQKYFNKIVKLETGKSPSQYKKEYLYSDKRS